MSKETFKNNSEKEIRPQLESKTTFEGLEKLGCQVERFAAGDIKTKYELNLESILSRWENIFSTRIKEHKVSKESLKQMAKEFLQEIEKIIAWLKEQPTPEQYRINHFINPYTGEHIMVFKQDVIARIYGVFVRFDREGVRLEHDNSFWKNKNFA